MKNSKTAGILYAVAAFGAWGVLPLYWKLLHSVSAWEILAHRIVWSFVFVSILIVFSGRWNSLKEIVSQKGNRVRLLISSLLISINWLLYIWAVNNDRIVECSLGYYITPLLSVLLGMLVLKERLGFWQMVCLVMALGGVAFLTGEFGKVPWIALALAVSFGLYGLVKKLANLDSLIALTLETIFVAPLALGYLVLCHIQGNDALAAPSLTTLLLLLGTGIVTATPLLWFAQGARRVPLSTLGFLQYLSPTISLIIGVFLFHEPFTKVHLISFALIWCSLLIYSLSGTEFMERMQPGWFKKKSLGQVN